MKKLLLTLVACVTALAANAATVYFENTGKWGSVYAYAWPTDPGWPGTQLNASTDTRTVAGVEYWYFETEKANIIFNNNNGQQTKDLTVSDGAVFSYAKNGKDVTGTTTDQIGTITKQADGSYTFTKAGEVQLTKGFLYFPVSTYNVSQAYLYTWGPDVAGTWTGTQLTKKEINGTEYWVFEIADNREITNKTFTGMQLNTGNSSNQKEWQNTTTITDGDIIDIPSKQVLGNDPYTFTPDVPEPDPDYMSWWVNLNGEFFDGNNGKQPNKEGIAEWTDQEIGNNTVWIKVYDGSDKFFYANSIPVGTWTNLSSADTDAASTIAGQRAGNVYNVQINVSTSPYQILVTLVKEGEISYPDNFYYIGNLGSNSWDLPGKPFENEGGGIYTLEDVNIGQSSTTNGYFALTTSDSSDWGQVNSNRYGPSASTEITLTGNEAEVSFVRNNNGDISWNITPGIYTLTISYDENLLTIEKTGDFDEPEPETPENLYLIANMETKDWTLPGKEFDADGDGIFVLSGVTLAGESGADSFLALTTSGSNEWEEVNANRYGPVSDKTKLELEDDVVEAPFYKEGGSSWQIEPGVYDITVSFEDNTITLEKTGEYNVPKLYILGNNINGKEDWDNGSEMTFSNGIYTWTGTMLGTGFKIWNGSWEAGHDYGIAEDSEATVTLGTPITVVNADGCKNITFDNLTWIQDPVVKFNPTELTVTVTGVKPLFLMGSEIIGAAEGSKPWTANDSYYFQKTGEGVYTLTVGSISSDCEFKIGTEDWTIAYSSKEMDMKANYATGYDLVTDQSAGNMGLVSSLLNATFTITLEATEDPINSAWGPYTSTANLVITGTEDNSTSWVLTLGNDKTMQDGTITDNNISITTANPNKGALVYVYAPAEAVAVYFKVTPTSQSAKRMAAPDLTGYTKAAVNPYDSEAYSLPLAEGSGSVSLYYEKADGDFSAEKTYTYTVKTGVTTGVDGIGADEEDAVYYNLQGVKVDNPEKGIFVKVVNGTASKVVL